MSNKFKSKEELDNFVIALIKMLQAWGLNTNDWLLGKYLFLYYINLFNNPNDIVKEATIYIIKSRLPWKSYSGRSIVPAGNTKYFKEFVDLQKKYEVGVDFYPVPDEQLDKNFIGKGNIILDLHGHQINVESIDKFVWQQLDIIERFKKKSTRALRNFYYADQQRYEARNKFNINLYNNLVKINRDDLLATTKKIINGYQELVKKAYPEIFIKSKNKKSKNIVNSAFGKTAFGEGIIKGQILIVDNNLDVNKIKKKKVLLFSHFSPVHVKYLNKAKLVITQGGGLLSHAAILCREQKIPCIVNINNNAKDIFSDDSKILADLDKGLIKKI